MVEFKPLKFGIVADIHYADRAPAINRCYRESPGRVRSCVEAMHRERVEFLVQLGDLKDQSESPTEASTLSFLSKIDAELRRFRGPLYHVLGNHDMDSISKDQFLAWVGRAGTRPHYSFDHGGVHFVVLDANYREDLSHYDHGNFDYTDANIPPAQIEWLSADLAAHQQTPTIVFCHQRLDGEGPLFVTNAEEVRTVLGSGSVRAVFQGHDHAGDCTSIDGIHYYTLPGLVEGPCDREGDWAVVTVSDDRVDIAGYGRARSASLPTPG